VRGGRSHGSARGSHEDGRSERGGETALQVLFYPAPLGFLFFSFLFFYTTPHRTAAASCSPDRRPGLQGKPAAAAARKHRYTDSSMAGVQVTPAAVGVAGLRGSGVGSTTGLFAGDWRRKARRPACSVWALRRQQRRSSSRSKGGGLAIVCNLAGQYEDSFDDVQRVRQTKLGSCT